MTQKTLMIGERAQFFLLPILAAALTLCAFAQSPSTDTSFQMGATPTPYMNALMTTAFQPDGKIIVGGDFSMLNVEGHYLIGRLKTTGRTESSWYPDIESVGEARINCLAMQPDGSVFFGGSNIVKVSGVPNTNMGRVFFSGSGDTNFSGRANGSVYCTSIQPDGKILIGGEFTVVGGQPRAYLGRLNLDGSLDATFAPTVQAPVESICVQPDGKVLAAVNTIGLFRFNPDGTPDAKFSPFSAYYLWTLALQPDGKILVGGDLNGLGRLNPDGSWDSSFWVPAFGLRMDCVALEADGGVVVGGLLTAGTVDNLFRINPDGTLDTNYNAQIGHDEEVYSVTLQPDGKSVLTGDSFGAPWPRPYIIRLNPYLPATQTLAFNGSTITWLRGGSSPEISYCYFEMSTDGVDWTRLGGGEHIVGGWQLTNVSCPPGANIRARGLVTSGYHNGSCWFAESIIGPPVAVDPPTDQTCDAGSSVGFSVFAGSTPPFSYQWLRAGTNLQDGPYISGATTSSLTLSNVTGDSDDYYSVIISNASGSITSSVASLTVSDPIVASSVGPYRIVHAGQNISLSADSIQGAAPLAYQWYKDGTAVPGATNSVLSLTNAVISQAGTYTLTVSNRYGTATGLVAYLSVSTAGPKVMTITPSIIPSDYVGPITIEISGLDLGQTVTLSQYFDLYANGVLDPNVDPLVAVYTLTDGSQTFTGGATNWNVLGDVTGADGIFRTVITFSGTKPQWPVGKTLFMLSDGYPAYDGSALTTNVLTITNAPAPQSISGRVIDGTLGIQGALVVLESSNICKGAALTDAQGNYSIAASPGAYEVQVFKQGYVQNSDNLRVVSLARNSSLNVDVTLVSPTRTIAGNLSSFPNGIGMFVRLRSSSGVVGVFPDRLGRFSARALPDIWSVELLEDSGLFRAGCMYVKAGSPGEQVIDARNGDVNSYTLNVSSGTAMIYGQLTNTLGFPLAGVLLSTTSTDLTNYFQSCGLSDTNGNYYAVVLPGQWQLQVAGGTLCNYSVPLTVANLTNGQSLRVDLAAEPIARCSLPVKSGPNQFSFQLDAASNYFYLIEVSTNLAVSNGWRLLSALQLGSDSVPIQDNNATGPQRYYRAVRY